VDTPGFVFMLQSGFVVITGNDLNSSSLATERAVALSGHR
jgi:hypothetical protein